MINNVANPMTNNVSNNMVNLDPTFVEDLFFDQVRDLTKKTVQWKHIEHIQQKYCVKPSWR